MNISKIAHAVSKKVNLALGEPDIDDLQLQIQQGLDSIQQIKQRHAALANVLAKIRSSSDLDRLFSTTTQETCQLLDVERVAVYQFNEDWSGRFISQFGSVLPEWDKIAPFGENMVWEDSHLQETKGGRYRTNESFAVADIYAAGHARCHIDLLEQFKVRAYAIAPIFNGHKLWGLLAAYQHSGPKTWDPTDVEFLAEVANHLGMAMKQSHLLLQLQRQTQALENATARQRSLAEVVSRIRASLDVDLVLRITCQEARQLLAVERVAVYRFNPDWSGEFIANFGSVIPEWEKIAPFGEAMLWEDSYLQETQGGRYRKNETFAVADIYQAGHARCHIDLLEQFKVRAYAIAPIFVGRKLWGLLAAYEHSGPKQWDDLDVEFLAQIGAQLGVAMQSATMVTESQLKAIEQEKAAEQRRILYEVVAKVRESLDLDTIFRTLSTEVRKTLSADRVGIYQFDSESAHNDGTFVAEDVAAGFPAALHEKVQDHCFGEIYSTQYSQGRTYALSDLQTANVQDCYREVLERFSIRSLMVAPIMIGTSLWGLLCVHECDQAREWENSEIQFIKQIADQLGIALQQSALLAKTTEQSDQLALTLQELQRTQVQIIQSEKMAGLGQLVAGVAHEINNPINFIHGNLNHTEEYMQGLLDLLVLYQEQVISTPEIATAIAKVDLPFLIEDLPKMLKSMQIGTDRIREIVLSLRNFSRLDEAEFKSVDIHDGLESTLMILAHRFKENPNFAGIEIERDYDNLPLVECYPGQLNQVFMNIIVNALDAIEEQPHRPEHQNLIRLWTEKVGSDRVAIHIMDNGGGIPDEVQTRLFDPFFTTKTVGKGTGLGLSISYQIITEKHSGKLICHTTPGDSTEFVIEIPIYQVLGNDLIAVRGVGVDKSAC
jgi:GAF domain-containing protein